MFNCLEYKDIKLLVMVKNFCSFVESSSIFSFFLFIVCHLLPTAVFSQSITFEKYYDTINCYNGQCVQQTFDKGYIITGTHSVNAGNNNLVILKTDSLGNPKWLKSYGGTNNDGGEFIQQTLDSGFIVVGEKDAISATDSKIWLLKTDKNGDTIWSKIITAGIGANLSHCLQQTTDGGYIITGYTSAKGAGSNDVFLAKTNSVGDTLWTKVFGGTGADVGTSVQQTTDGGYIITGYTFSFNPEIDMYLIKTNSNGDTLWTKVFKGNNNQTRGFSVYQTIDGGYVIAGILSIPPSNYLVSYLVKTDVNGDTLWTKKYFDSVSNEAYAVKQTNDGGYIIIINGGAGIGAGIIRTNSSGDIMWTKSYGESHAVADYGTITYDGGCIVTGQYDQYSPYSIYLLKTDSAGFAITRINETSSIQNNISIYPNPFSESATVIIAPTIADNDLQYEIFDLLGNSVRKVAVGKRSENIKIERGNLTDGIYILKIYSDKYSALTKMIVQ